MIVNPSRATQPVQRRNYRVSAGLPGEPPTHFRDRSMVEGTSLSTMVRWLRRGYAFAPYDGGYDLGGHDVGDVDEDPEFDPICAPAQHRRGPIFVSSLHTIYSRLRDPEPEPKRAPTSEAELKRLRFQASKWNRKDADKMPIKKKSQDHLAEILDGSWYSPTLRIDP